LVFILFIIKATVGFVELRIAISTRTNTTGKVIAHALHNNDRKKEQKEIIYNFFLNILLDASTSL